MRVSNPAEVGADASELEAPGPRGHRLGERFLPRAGALDLGLHPVAGVQEPAERRFLPDPWGADGHTVEELQRLVDEWLTGADGADPIAGNRIFLREAVQRDQGVFPIGSGVERVRRCIGRSEVAVRLVEDQGDASGLAQIEEAVEDRRWNRGSGRVSRADEQDGASPIGDERCRRFGIGEEIGAGLEEHRRDSLEIEPHPVIEVVRDADDHLVARFAQGRCHDAEGLIAAGGDLDVVGGDPGRGLGPPEFVGERRPEFGKPFRRGVPPTLG